MKAQWNYQGPHARKRLRREGLRMSISSKLTFAIVVLLVMCMVVYAIEEVDLAGIMAIREFPVFF